MKLVNICKAQIKKYGWKVALGIFCGYLIRDIALYIAIPYFIVTAR